MSTTAKEMEALMNETVRKFNKAMANAFHTGTGVLKVEHILAADIYLPPPPKPYGCWNRQPIVTVCKPTCQYTYTTLGQADERCYGCKERGIKAAS
jgi:hypothetical protein